MPSTGRFSEYLLNEGHQSFSECTSSKVVLPIYSTDFLRKLVNNHHGQIVTFRSVEGISSLGSAV
jgi:hypothetical protein